MPTSPLGKEAVRLVAEMPNCLSRTLARRLAKEFRCSIEAARTAVRYAKGTTGSAHRAHRRNKRATKRKSGWVAELPPSQSAPWVPFELNEGKIGVISDAHFPYHSEHAVKAAVEHLRGVKIDTLLINGDWLDFYSISRWQKDPRKRNFKNEIEIGRQSLEWVRSRFPKARIVYKWGNHEERWHTYLWNHAPEICDLEQVQLQEVLQLEQYNIEYVGDQRPVLAGELPIFHGHELGRSVFSPVNPARGAFLRAHHTVLIGHYHQTSSHADTDLWHNETSIWSAGCLCDLKPEYARINRWNHGFAVVEVFADKSFGVQNLRVSRRGRVRSS